MEHIKELLTRLVKLSGGEPDNIVIEAYCKAICEEVHKTYIEDKPKTTTDNLIDELDGFRYIHPNMYHKIIHALTGNEDSISLSVAKALSQFYGHIHISIIRKALEDKEIIGNIPTKKDVTITLTNIWKHNETTFTRQQPIGGYKLNTKSFVQWLNRNYKCKCNSESSIKRCLIELAKEY